MGIKKGIARILRSLVMLFEEEKKVPIPAPVNAPEILKGKVALITGGSGGIGMAMARSFLDSGAKVVIAGTSGEKCEQIVKKLGGGLAFPML